MIEFAVFFFFAAVAVIFALVVVLHRNPVVGALALVASFFALAVMYVLLDAPFLAALQVIVYAGAIMVLFLFVIMLLNLQHWPEDPTRPIQQFLGYFGSAAFGISLVYYISKYAVSGSGLETRFVTSAKAIGVRLFEAYILPFEMVSILLLAAIVGALVLTGKATAIAGVIPTPSVVEGEGPGGGVALSSAHSAGSLAHASKKLPDFMRVSRARARARARARVFPETAKSRARARARAREFLLSDAARTPSCARDDTGKQVTE